jgi:hypothetical protein
MVPRQRRGESIPSLKRTPTGKPRRPPLSSNVRTRALGSRVSGYISREWSMVVLRAEFKATHRSASSLRAGAASARFSRGSRAAQSRRPSGLPSRRGPRVARGCGSYPPARAVPGFFASPSSPACAGAHQVRFVGSTAARGPLAGSGVGFAPGVAFRSNCVFIRTAGDFAVLNQSPLAAAG